jgi:putative lipoprotein
LPDENVMSPRHGFAVAALLFLAFAALAVAQTPSGPHAASQVTGSVSYEERGSLPKKAILDMQLLDVSRAGAPAAVIGETRIGLKGKRPPIAFVVQYDESKIVASNRYTLRATIKEGGKLLFTSTGSYPVLTRGAPREVELELQPTPKAAGPPRPVTLAGPRWELVELDGRPVDESEADNVAASLLFDAGAMRVSGSGGCNRLTGAYSTDGSSLFFEGVTGTMMACPGPAMSQEKNFLDALALADSFKIDGDRLELRRGDKVLARFQAQAEE